MSGVLDVHDFLPSGADEELLDDDLAELVLDLQLVLGVRGVVGSPNLPSYF